MMFHHSVFTRARISVIIIRLCGEQVSWSFIDTTSPIRQIELYKKWIVLIAWEIWNFEFFCIFNVHTSCHYQLIRHSGTLRPRGIHNSIMWSESYRRLILIVIVVVYFKTNSKYFVVICYQHNSYSLKEFQISKMIVLFHHYNCLHCIAVNCCELLLVTQCINMSART